MTGKSHNADIDVFAAGRAIYAKLQSRLKVTDKGSFVVIDAVSGDYEVDPSPAAAKRRLEVPATRGYNLHKANWAARGL